MTQRTGNVLEFGVFSGYSINFFSNEMTEGKDKRIIYGFDSFEGLSETWGGTTLAKGHFDVQGFMPKVNKNVTLMKGWIQDSFPVFVADKDLETQKVAFKLIDVNT